MQTFLSILFRINHQKQESSNRKTLNIYCVAMCDVLDKQWSCCTSMYHGPYTLLYVLKMHFMLVFDIHGGVYEVLQCLLWLW